MDENLVLFQGSLTGETNYSSSSGWQTETKLNGISGGTLSHNSMLGLFLFKNIFFVFILFYLSFSIFLSYRFFVYIILLSVQWALLGGFLSMENSESVHINVSFPFPWGLFLLFSLSYCDVSFCLILLYFCYPLGACLFSNETERGWIWMVWEVGRCWDD